MIMQITITEKDLENGFTKWFDEFKKDKGKFTGDGNNPAHNAACVWTYLTVGDERKCSQRLT